MRAAGLVLALLAGFLIIDAALDCWHQLERRRTQRARDRAARRPPPTWRR